MAEKRNAVGILFDVKGGGDINGQSGGLIRQSINNICSALNTKKVATIRLHIDDKAIKDKVNELKKLIESLNNLSGAATSGGNSRGGNGNKKSYGGVSSEEYKKRTKALKEYYAVLEKVEKARTRTDAITESNGSYDTKDDRWKPLIDQLREAERGYEDATNAVSGFSAEQQSSFAAMEKSLKLHRQVANQTNISNAQESWRKLTSNVNQYIDRVEYSASRNKDAARALQELRDLANNGNYQNYDQLKQKLAEVEAQINRNRLATETWGQKMLKTFGSRIRSAIAGIFTAKLGQVIADVYKNVVKLDEAIVNLQIASGKNREEVKRLVKEYSNLAKQLGATTAEVAAGADTWLRQGLSESETEEMIKNTMMLSKLGQMESEEAAKALTSAMKGYNIAVKDTISIVDKWTAVDMEAAANAGDLATAMSETATSAGLAGVEMDTLIGYIATVKEVTQDGAESVGIFFKTLFARMNNVKAGKFVDDETGEALNDVEKVLGELDIALRNTNGTFRDSGDVLDEVASKWNTYDNVQQHAIATAFAGMKQQEKFIVLMENYGDAAKYAGIAADSAGIATEKFGAHTEGIQGKVAALTAAYEGLSMSILDSGLITGLVEMVTRFVDFMSIGDAVPTKIALCIAAVVALVGATQALTAAVVRFNAALNAPTTGLLTYIKHVWSLVASQGAAKVATDKHTEALVRNYTTGVSGVLTLIPRAIAAVVMWASSVLKAKLSTDLMTTSSITLKAALDALNVNPVMLVITALVAAGAVLVGVYKRAQQAAEEAAKKEEERLNAIKETADAEKKESEELDELIARYKELRNSEYVNADAREEIRDIQKQINKLVKDESNIWDGINDSLDDTVQHLTDLRKQQYSDELTTARENYEAWLRKANGTKHTSYDTDSLWLAAQRLGIGGIEYDLSNFDLVVNGLDSAAVSILQGIEGISDAVSKEGSTAIQFEDMDAFGYVETIESAIDALEKAPGYNTSESDLVDGLKELKEKYSTYVDNVKSGFDSMLESTMRNELLALEDSAVDIKTVRDYTAIRDKFVNSVLSDGWIDYAITEGIASSSDVVINEAIGFFDSVYGSAFDSIAFNISKQSPNVIIDAIKDKFDLVSNALSEMTERGILSPDTVADIFNPENGFEDIQKYVQMTADGWIIDLDALEKLMTEKRDEFVSVIDELRSKGIIERNRDDIDVDRQWLEHQLEMLKHLESTNPPNLSQIKNQIFEIEASLADVEDQEALLNAINNLEQFDVVAKTLFSDIEDGGDISPHAFVSMFEKIKEPYEELRSAMDEFAENRFLSPETVANIFESFPDLEPYIIRGADGAWNVVSGAIDKFRADMRAKIADPEQQKLFDEIFNMLEHSNREQVDVSHPFVAILEEIEGPYNALKDAIDEWTEDELLSADTVAKILGDFPELQEYIEKQMDGTWTVVDGAMDEFIARLRAKIWATGDKNQLTWFDSVIKTLGIDSENVQDKIDTYLEVYDDVAGPLKALQSAASEFNETGFVSHDTVADILNPDGGFPELAQYLEETADGYKYNVDAIERFLLSKREEYDAVILSNEVGSEAREAAKQNKRWLEMVIETIRRESGEYKSFADILDDVANKYSAVSSAIEDMEKYGKLSKGSLSSILNDEDLKAYLTLNKDGSYSFDVDAFDKWAATEEQRLRDLRDSYMEGTDAYIEADSKLQEHIAAVTAAKVSTQKEEEHPFVKMLNSIRGPYELLVKAAKEMEEGGLTPDTLAKIFVDFPELEKYLETSIDGTKSLTEGALTQFVTDMRNTITDQDDLNLFDYIVRMLGIENAKEPEEVVDTFSEMLEYIRGPYDALKTAMDEMAEGGALTTDTIDKLLGDFPELEAYVERGADGLYRLVQGETDALQRWIENKRNEFTSDEQRSLFDDIIRLLGLEGEEEPEFVNPLSAILEEVESSYDLLRSAKEDMEEYGVISESTLSSLASLAEEDYEALKNYFTLTADGYTMCEDALEQYVEAKKKEYVAVLASAEVGSDAYNEAYKNLANLLAVFMTLSLSDQIEEATEALEDQTEALEDQREVLEAEQDAWEDRRDAYQDIIDYRKELLQTFKEELDYQRELEQRQRAVADLQTRLSVARLDRSAAGRAKVRELEDELASAEEELNDFTLEHAIEQITSQMDREADEYNRFIDSKIAEIDSAIEDVETEIENVRTAIENVSRNIRSGVGNITAQIDALLREYGITPPSPSPEIYHSGGFVGGVATLKSNEEFAKLMVGEHVSTPAQIQRFMNETLPGIASNSSRNEFNAPLISIECESVTTEALPGLKQIVNEAVREVKKQLDDGFSRTGYKKPVTRPI